MSILQRVRNAFDVPSRRRDLDYSKRISPRCRYGILLLYRDYLRERPDDYWLPEVQGEMAHSHPPLAETQAWDNDGFTPIAQYLQHERTPASALLDFLELSLRHWRAPNTDNDFVDAINRVLDEYDAPYLLTRYGFVEEPIQGGRGDTYDKAVSFPRVYLKHDTVVQEQTIEPALELFSDPAYETPAKDFRTALERQKNGDYDGCVTSCAAAVEGTLKVVAAKNRWRVRGTGLICFDLSTPLKEFPHALFSGLKKLVVGAVDLWARGARVWAGGGQRASVVHGLSTRPEGRAPVRKDSSTYPRRSRTASSSLEPRYPCDGDGRAGSGQGRADSDGGSC